MFFFQSGAWAAQEKFKFLGPTELLDNGKVTLEVSLKIGRIVSFQAKGGANWLVVFDKSVPPDWHWNPWGGNRVWPTAQFLFPQIYGNKGADPMIDGAPWTLISKSSTSLEMKSGLSPRLGLQITERIELPPDRTEVLQTFRLERKEKSCFPVHVWNITGVQEGDSVLMESNPAVPYPGDTPFKWFRDFSDSVPDAALVGRTQVLKVAWPSKPMKIGTYGRWIALLHGSSVLKQSIQYDSTRPYLEGCSLQTFINPETLTFEIETLSPTWCMSKGEVENWQVNWKLLELPPGLRTDNDRALYLSKDLN